MIPWAYLTLTFAFAITPGATTAVVIGHTLGGGRRRGLAASLGAMAANGTQALLAMAGVSALLVRWPESLAALKFGGALFLTWLGLKALKRAFGRASADAGRQPVSPIPRTPQPFRDGFAVNVLNPSITSFYVGVVPGFLSAGSAWRGLALLYGAHIAMAFACQMFWITLFFRARALFTRDRPRRMLDAAFGVLLIALAIRIAVR